MPADVWVHGAAGCCQDIYTHSKTIRVLFVGAAEAVTALCCAAPAQECQASLQAAQQSTADRDEALGALADELVEVNAGLEEAEAARQQANEQV